VSPIAGCKSDSDCSSGALCVQNARSDNYAPLTFACELPGDRCRTDEDCTQGYDFCSITETGRVCTGASICGRPFLVAGQPRLASTRRNASWTERTLGALERPDDPNLVRRLVDHWTEIALMEHASVAAFARFTLQLMELGAPAELIEEATRAQSDEIRHARVAFDLASHYGARPVAPGPLDLCGIALGSSLEDVVTTTIDEGCVGETLAALELAQAAEQVADETLRALLETIAQDEARHAALAWKAVHWIVQRHPELHGVCEREFARVAESLRPPIASDDSSSASARYGVLSASTRAAIGMQAMSDVIVPCARALLCPAQGDRDALTASSRSA
jgi:hypothetical protein